MRDPRAPFRMRWAVDSVREANVAATNYILGQLKEAGILHRVLDAEQQRQGRQWVESLQVAPGSYEDPALLAYKPPIWDDAAEPWPPTAAHKEAMNQYSHGCLRGYGVDGVDQLQIPPPPDWPQQDEPERVLPWIKSVEPNWSWIGRMVKRLADWRLAGTTPIDPLLDCLRWVYSRQDPRTGFWGPGIQTTFKILIAVFEPMGLTVPRAETLIDSVLAKMYHPEYDDNLFPCEEFDAFYDLAAANDHAPGYRREEILKLAAHRIAFILDTRLQADEGLASYPDHCIPTWLKWDMAPSVRPGRRVRAGHLRSGLRDLRRPAGHPAGDRLAGRVALPARERRHRLQAAWRRGARGAGVGRFDGAPGAERVSLRGPLPGAVGLVRAVLPDRAIGRIPRRGAAPDPDRAGCPAVAPHGSLRTSSAARD